MLQMKFLSRNSPANSGEHFITQDASLIIFACMLGLQLNIALLNCFRKSMCFMIFCSLQWYHIVGNEFGLEKIGA